MGCEVNGTKHIISAKLRHATHKISQMIPMRISITISEKWVRSQ